jgi:archaellum component FlaC
MSGQTPAVQLPGLTAPPGTAPAGPPPNSAQRNTLAAVIAFAACVVALYAIMGYMNETVDTLQSVNRSNDSMVVKMQEANEGLLVLESKTSEIEGMNALSVELRDLLTTIDKDMGGMLTSVDGIGTHMQSTNTSLDGLDSELTEVAKTNENVATTLGTIGDGLGDQQKNVQSMSRDLKTTGQVIGSMPSLLTTTNKRLAFTNKIVCKMGHDGIGNQIRLTIKFLPITVGTANIFATTIPKGAWRC